MHEYLDPMYVGSYWLGCQFEMLPHVQVFSSKIGLAPYCEVAFYHKKAKLLMVTDAVVYIPEDPPEVVSCLATSAQCLLLSSVL